MGAFIGHPSSVGETYWQHLGRALRTGISLAGAAAACMVHALFPFLLEKTASGTISRLNDEILALRADDPE